MEKGRELKDRTRNQEPGLSKQTEYKIYYTAYSKRLNTKYIIQHTASD